LSEFIKFITIPVVLFISIDSFVIIVYDMKVFIVESIIYIVKTTTTMFGSETMSKLIDRENYIIKMLLATGRLSTSEVVEALGVSEATVRRVFVSMENSGKIIRNYGGIILPSSIIEYSFETHTKEAAHEKKIIGKLASTIVEEGDVIYLDCGTTVFNMTLVLDERVNNQEITNVTIVTNSIANVLVLTPSISCKVVLIGGMYNGARRDFSGILTESYLQSFHFTKCFLGADGVSSSMAVTSTEVEISQLNKSVMKRSDKTYILIDHSKFGKNSFISYARLSDVTGIVTDWLPGKSIIDSLEAPNIQIYYPAQSEEADQEDDIS
jgi:DeoR family fructose operon transcriptional repressor